MIVVEIKLVSARGSEHNEELGTIVIDNITTPVKMRALKGAVCDYRCRTYRKGALAKAGDPRRLVADHKPTREGVVSNHHRHRQPVSDLVAKALTALNYGK